MFLNPKLKNLAIILAITAVFSWYLYFKDATAKDTVDINLFPKTINGWTSVELPITADEFAILETKNAFVRKYTNPLDKSEVYLYIVYSQNNRKVAHPPEICYTGSGMSILESVHDPIKVAYKNITIGTNRLHLTKGDLNHISFYWFKVGDQFTPNYWKQQILIALNTLIGRKTSSALVRISADVVDGDKAKTINSIKVFTNAVVKDLFNYLP